MSKKINRYLIVNLLVFSWFLGTTLKAQNKQEITVTIEGISSTAMTEHFNKAEELRNNGKYDDAIEEYKKVVNGGEMCEKTAEAHYDIGLCYTWLGKKNDAEAVFKEVLKKYPGNKKVVAFTKYCLSWVDVQKGNYESAIDRLQRTLDENSYPDEEFCSRAQFQIGRIYQAYMHEYEKAESAFKIVLEKYPNSKITGHAFFEKLKAEK